MPAKDKYDEIIEYFVESKRAEVVDKFASRVVNKKIINPITPVNQLQLLAEEQSDEKLKTGTLMDNLLGGGLKPKSTMLLYGQYGSGKTQTCFTMAVLCPDTVIYIDTEGSYSPTRIKQIAEAHSLDWKHILEEKIVLFQIDNWVDQMLILNAIPSPADVGKIGLIIADSISKRFRGVEFAGRQELTEKQPLVREFIFKLEQTSKLYNSAVVYTTQVYEDPNQVGPMAGGWTKFKPVGGSSIEHQPDYVVCLRRGEGNVRIARMVDASWQPLAEAPFLITDKGIEPLPTTEVAQAILEKAEIYGKKQAGSELLVKKRKKKGGQQELVDAEEAKGEVITEIKEEAVAEIKGEIEE